MPTEDADKLPPLAELEAAVQRWPADLSAWRRLARAYAALGVFDLAAEMPPQSRHRRRLRHAERPRLDACSQWG